MTLFSKHALTIVVVFLGCTWNATLPVHAKSKSKAHKVDHLALAGVLIRDGHLSRAESVLAGVDLKQKGLDLGRYHMLRGILFSKRKLYAQAARSFRVAIAKGQTQPLIFLFLAQAEFRVRRYDAALQSLRKAPPEAHKMLGTVLLKVQCLWKLKRIPAAYRALRRGQRRFPADRDLMRLRVLLLIELKLFRTAVQVGRRWLRHPKTPALAFLRLAEALRKNKQFRASARLLEQANLRFPNHPHVELQLSRVYLEAKMPLAAAGLLARAARKRPKLRVEAAELYRRANRYWLAMYHNAQVLDQKAKIRQRLALLIDLRRYEAATTLVPRLRRLKLAQDQPIAYALAYAFFKTRRFKRAEQWLSLIHARTLFQRTIPIRKAIQRCRQDKEQCL